MFYISTRGSTASAWLTKALNKHKKIICLRSSRSIPPLWPGYTSEFDKNSWIKEISVEKYIESLTLFEKATEGEKIFGGCHGYHGTEAKKIVENYKGKFSYLTRHPITMIHSALIFGAYVNIYKKNKKISNSKVSERVNAILRDIDLNKIYKKFNLLKKIKGSKKNQNIVRKKMKQFLPEQIVEFIKEKKLKMVIKKKFKEIKKKQKSEKLFLPDLFINILDSFFLYENQLFYNCNRSDGFKMEELVKSKNYFKNFIRKKIDTNLNINENYLNEVFKIQRYNIHRKKPLSPIEVWRTWPENMQEVFIEFYQNYKIKKSSDFFNYKMPF
tara:strand:+ start:73 stop:1056 length:984 start_codon:yes stop_codon:yes gene_type:complete